MTTALPMAIDLAAIDPTRVHLWTAEPRLGYHEGPPRPSIGIGAAPSEWQQHYAEMRLFLADAFVHAVRDEASGAWRAIRWSHADLAADAGVQLESDRVYLRQNLARFGLESVVPAKLPRFGKSTAQSGVLWLHTYRRDCRPLTWRLALDEKTPTENCR